MYGEVQLRVILQCSTIAREVQEHRLGRMCPEIHGGAGRVARCSPTLTVMRESCRERATLFSSAAPGETVMIHTLHTSSASQPAPGAVSERRVTYTHGQNGGIRNSSFAYTYRYERGHAHPVGPEQGDPSAAEQLLPLVYEELEKLAAQKAQEKPVNVAGHGLVHEAYLRLVGDQHFDNRGHFAAAEAMRRILRKRPDTRPASNMAATFSCELDGRRNVAATPEETLAVDELLARIRQRSC